MSPEVSSDERDVEIFLRCSSDSKKTRLIAYDSQTTSEGRYEIKAANLLGLKNVDRPG